MTHVLAAVAKNTRTVTASRRSLPVDMCSIGPLPLRGPLPLAGGGKMPIPHKC